MYDVPFIASWFVVGVGSADVLLALNFAGLKTAAARTAIEGLA